MSWKDSVTAKTNEHDKASNRPFGGRIRRYAKVTSTMGAAARVAGERYLGWNIDRENMPLTARGSRWFKRANHEGCADSIDNS